MKKVVPSRLFIGATGVAVFVAAAFALGAAEQEPTAPPSVTSVFKVEGMTCGGCEASVKMTVKRLDGVRGVEASHTEKRATVTYDAEKVTPQAIVDGIERLGYTAELVETTTASEEPKTTGLLAKLRACC